MRDQADFKKVELQTLHSMMIAEVRKPSKRRPSNLRFTLEVWAKRKDEFNSVDKKTDIRIEGISLSSELLGPV